MRGPWWLHQKWIWEATWPWPTNISLAKQLLVTQSSSKKRYKSILWLADQAKAINRKKVKKCWTNNSYKEGWILHHWKSWSPKQTLNARGEGGEVAINTARFHSHIMQNIRQDPCTVYVRLYSRVPEFPLHSALSALKIPIQSHGTKHRHESEPKFKVFQNLRLETLDLIFWL